MHKLLTTEEWMLRCLVGHYECSGDTARVAALVRAAHGDGVLLSPCQAKSHLALFESGEEPLPEYAVKAFLQHFKKRKHTNRKKRLLLAAE